MPEPERLGERLLGDLAAGHVMPFSVNPTSNEPPQEVPAAVRQGAHWLRFILTAIPLGSERAGIVAIRKPDLRNWWIGLTSAPAQQGNNSLNNVQRARSSDAIVEAFVQKFVETKKSAGQEIITEGEVIKAAENAGLKFGRQQIRDAKKTHAPGARGRRPQIAKT
jgi:hypothetical protein